MLDIYVKEPPLDYLKKQIEKNDWLKGRRPELPWQTSTHSDVRVGYLYQPFIYGGSFQPTKHTVLIL